MTSPVRLFITDRRLHDLVTDGGHLRPVVRADDGRHQIAAERGPRSEQQTLFSVDFEFRAVRGKPAVYLAPRLWE